MTLRALEGIQAIENERSSLDGSGWERRGKTSEKTAHPATILRSSVLMMSKKVTILDIAAHAGVDRSTVSLALRGDKRITELTRRKVENSANDLGYLSKRLIDCKEGGTPEETVRPLALGDAEIKVGKRVTIVDVAAHAGVDYSTVSLALRGDTRITDQTRLKVEESAKRLGYMPNNLARSLSGGSTRVLGVMFTEMSRFFSEPLEILQTAGERAGYTLSVHFSSWRQDREREGLRRFCESCVDGVIWAPSQWAGDSLVQMAQDLEKQRIPCVLLGLAQDERITSCHQVGGLREEPIRLAIGHLKDLGHRRIALVTAASMPGMFGGMHRHRLPTYYVVLKELGITVRQQDIFDTFDHDHGGLEVAVALSKRPRSDWPSAILATDDMLSRGLAKGLAALGISVPRDISLMGFDVVQDQSAEAELLTSVSLEAENTARHAIDLMLSILDRKNGTPAPQRIIISPKLITGHSCAAFPPSDT